MRSPYQNKKNIVIIGGGISGLACLHYIKRRFNKDPGREVVLLEKSDQPGGTVRSLKTDNFIFETGPNGFLNAQGSTFEFLNEIGLSKEIISARPESKRRYVAQGNRLWEVPANPPQFFRSGILPVSSKIRILMECLIPRGNQEKESVYAFGERRLGKRFTEILLDAMVSGIYAGDCQELVLKEAFPRISELEQKYGSLLKAQWRLKQQNKNKGIGSPNGILQSLKEGMGQAIDRLHALYKEDICTGEEVQSIQKDNGGYLITTAKQEKFYAARVILSLPAYAAATVSSFDNDLSNNLRAIRYAPVAVVGLLYNKADFFQGPAGYGYLIPSSEKKSVLGVLYESSIFPGRCDSRNVLFRVMIGGIRHPEIVDMAPDALERIAKEEIEKTLNVKAQPQRVVTQLWRRAIPQYDQVYATAKANILRIMEQHKNLHIVNNYLNGISFNDCIQNAKRMADII